MRFDGRGGGRAPRRKSSPRSGRRRRSSSRPRTPSSRSSRSWPCPGSGPPSSARAGAACRSWPSRPIVGGRALKGPADRMLRSLGSEASALGVARRYVGLVDGFVIDEADRDLGPSIAAPGPARPGDRHDHGRRRGPRAARRRPRWSSPGAVDDGPLPWRRWPRRPDQSDQASGSPRADLASLHVVVPVRTLAGGKARLGEAIDAEERQGLIAGMLRDELAVLGAWGLRDGHPRGEPRSRRSRPLATCRRGAHGRPGERRPERGDPRRPGGRRACRRHGHADPAGRPADARRAAPSTACSTPPMRPWRPARARRWS